VQLEADFDRTLAELRELARIPGVSATGFDPRELERSAQAVAARCCERLSGWRCSVCLARTRTSSASGSARGRAADRPDLRPRRPAAGSAREWLTPAFEPTLRADGRLYGAAWSTTSRTHVHVAALRAVSPRTAGCRAT
jgi:hypothetical protein